VADPLKTCGNDGLQIESDQRNNPEGIDTERG
jgi:hypothetical protein